MTQLVREATQQEAQEKKEFLKGIPDDDIEEIVMESFPKPSTILKAGLCPFLLGDELKSTKLWPFNDGGFTVICEDANQTLPRMPANAYRYVAGRLLPPVPNVAPPVIPDASQVNGEELKRGKLWPFLFGGESAKLPTMPATAHHMPRHLLFQVTLRYPRGRRRKVLGFVWTTYRWKRNAVRTACVTLVQMELAGSEDSQFQMKEVRVHLLWQISGM